MQSLSQCGVRKQYDVIVIGSGLAGLAYCIRLCAAKPNIKLALICKRTLSSSNTFQAQGGIAATPNQNQQQVKQHIEDTLKSGCYLNQQSLVEALISVSDEAINFLINAGVTFDKNKNGCYDLAQEGGHSNRRIYHWGDRTGQEIIRALSEQIKQYPQIDVYEHHCAVNLITQEEPHKPQSRTQVVGAYILNESTGLIDTYLAKMVILATGGAGKIFRYTTNPDTATGDGIAMAYRAGARVGDMEFYQFHPTVLYHSDQHNFLLTEALRGEGAYLRLMDTGERFMQRYAPEQMELATRDIVARAIFSEIERCGHSFVHLDIRHRSKEYLANRFPGIYQSLLQLNIDMSKDLIPVVPAAHYLCGGILTDISGQTDLDGLLAIGETAFTGFHGANRLASNSLLECAIMAMQAADLSFLYLEKPLEIQSTIKNWDSNSVTDLRRATQIKAHWRGLRDEMNSYAGIIRTEAGLKDLLRLIKTRREMIEEYYWEHTVTTDLVELRNIVLVAELIVQSSLRRGDSVGCHYREDHPIRAQECEKTLLKLSIEN